HTRSKRDWSSDVCSSDLIDTAAREVTLDGHAAQLTAREFELLEFVTRAPRQVFRREELLERVWGFTYGDTATVTVHVRRLREKRSEERRVGTEGRGRGGW